MKFLDIFPIDNGASDAADSARFNGMLVLVKHPKAIDSSKYFVNNEPVRCPAEPGKSSNIRMMSRDQIICLAASLMIQGRQDLIASIYNKALAAGHKAPNDLEDDLTVKKYAGDYMLPHIMGVLKKAAGLQKELSGEEKIFLVGDILFNAIFTPLRESNQLIALCYMAGPKWLKFYKFVTPAWRMAINLYWRDSYRNEPELAAMLIAWLESI